MVFNITIENKEKRLQKAHAMHIMAGLLVLVYGIRGFYDLPNTSMQLYTALPASVVILFIAIFQKRRLQNIDTNRIFRVLEAAFVFMGALHFYKYHIVFLAVLFFIASVGILFLSMLESQLLNGYDIIVDEKGVTRPGIGKQTKTIPWNEINNVIAKDRILTVDLKNNYLMQSKFTNFMTESEVDSFNSWSKGYLV